MDAPTLTVRSSSRYLSAWLNTESAVSMSGLMLASPPARKNISPIASVVCPPPAYTLMSLSAAMASAISFAAALMLASCFSATSRMFAIALST